MNVKVFLLATALTVCASLHASTSYTFDFTNQDLNQKSTLGGGLVFNSNIGAGLTVTATAFSTADLTHTLLQQAYVGEYSGNGIGICTVAEGGAACVGAQHQVDNSGQFEFMLLTFSAQVNLSSITLHNTGGSTDMDMSYWTSPTFMTLNGTNISTVGQKNDLCGGGGSQPACNPTALVDPLSTPGNTQVRSLLIAAAYTPGVTGGDAIADFFKISSLIVTTPEPASFVLIGSGLLIGAGIGRRRMKKK